MAIDIPIGKKGISVEVRPSYNVKGDENGNLDVSVSGDISIIIDGARRKPVYFSVDKNGLVVPELKFRDRSDSNLGQIVEVVIQSLYMGVNEKHVVSVTLEEEGE